MAIKWRQDSVKSIREAKAAAAKAEAMNAQTQVAVMAFCATATTITNDQAIQMPDLFPGLGGPSGRREQAGGKHCAPGWLHPVPGGPRPGGVIPQEHQPPHGEGMLAVYRPIDEGHAGTLEDPIPWVYGMDCHAGTYFSYNGHIYLVAEGGDMIPCVWPPDTAGLWQWVLVE